MSLMHVQDFIEYISWRRRRIWAFSALLASNKNRTAEHTYQSQYRTQQGMSYQYFQIQVFFGYKWPHYYFKEC